MFDFSDGESSFPLQNCKEIIRTQLDSENGFFLTTIFYAKVIANDNALSIFWTDH